MAEATDGSIVQESLMVMVDGRSFFKSPLFSRLTVFHMGVHLKRPHFSVLFHL
jgi:hypothetical protein